MKKETSCPFLADIHSAKGNLMRHNQVFYGCSHVAYAVRMHKNWSSGR